MASGGGDPPLTPACNGGEFLLSLLQKPRHQSQTPLQQLPAGAGGPIAPPQQSSLPIDPAVAAVGPTINFPPQWPVNGRDIPPPWPHSVSPPFPHNFLGFSQNPWSSPANQQMFPEDFGRLGFTNANYALRNLIQPPPKPQDQQQGLVFGSFQSKIQNQIQPESLLNFNPLDDLKYNYPSELDRKRQFDPRTSSVMNPNSCQHTNLENSREQDGRLGKQHHGSTPPPGFSSKARGGGDNSRRGFEHGVDKSNRVICSSGEDGRLRRLSMRDGNALGLIGQLDHPGPLSGSNLYSVSALDVEESISDLHREDRERGWGQEKMRRETDAGYVKGGNGDDMHDFGEELVDSLLPEDETDFKNDKHEVNDKKQRRNSRDKESRSDNRGKRLLSQRVRNLKWRIQCRVDIGRLNAPFFAIYESLIPAEEEKAKQEQLLTLLEKLVRKEWPDARLYLYGSCANSFGVSKSDIDVCLAINDAEMNKSEVLLKLADILQTDNLQNVQALTRARVPIVKLMDPVTGISCDICINNLLAVVNTKLLRDYAQIDVRLRQLAFIIKHWAKSRGVNETYQGTLSSYAYVLMCIHFLQQRRPAILPCLQGKEKTYSVTVDNIEYAYFDRVEELRNFGSRNKETIAQLVWEFFSYWAYGHDYANNVISVRTGSIIRKLEKDWTRRVGNDRHLICIEDPFEITHDLGRVVDKYSIKVLREEFERAAEIMRCDPNPCATLFEPYVPN